MKSTKYNLVYKLLSVKTNVKNIYYFPHAHRLDTIIGGKARYGVGFFVNNDVQKPKHLDQQFDYFWGTGGGGAESIYYEHPILHYSADNVINYIRKFNWRIKNNIYHKKGMGKTGYTGREGLTNINRTFKYLFVPYSLSIVLPMIDAVYLSVSRKDVRYLLHVPLALYTALMIVYHGFRAMAGYYDILKNYDGTKEVEGGNPT